MRGNTTGLVGKFLDSLKGLEKSYFEINLLDIGFFDIKHNPQNYPVDFYYDLPHKPIERLVRKLPGLRTRYAEELIISCFRRIVSEKKINVVILYHIPSFADRLTDICHKYNIRVIFYPGGSDILRVNNKTKKRLMDAFSKVDYVVGGINSNTIIGSKDIYSVPEDKIKTKKNYISGVKMLMELDREKPRSEMMQIVGMDFADYNIVCSYNGYPAHRHKQIIQALADNKDVLPKNYKVIFPMTYGCGKDYVEELSQACVKEGLNATFITSFLSAEQMAYLHLVTDLFIEIQPTDAGNAFMIESLYAGNKIVTGRWLNYKQFEQFGEPYYLIDRPEDLSAMLRLIFTGQAKEIKVPQQLIDMYTIPQNYDKYEFWRILLRSCGE